MSYNIYFSPTGGTKKVADILVSNLTGEFCQVDICREIEKMSLQAKGVCLISVPSFAGRVPAVAAVAEHSVLRQFAAGSPDEVDAQELADFARKITAKLDSGVFGKLELAGSHRTYKQIGSMPFKPEASDACDGCGICTSGCTGARSTKRIPARPIKMFA